MADGHVEGNHRPDANTRTACFRCRGFRHACDRNRPQCSRCKAKDVRCVYPEAAPTMKQLQQLADELAGRVASLQKTAEAMSGAQAMADHVRNQPLLMRHFARYPCQKCNHHQQACDMRLPRCGRCTDHGIRCTYAYEEKPKVYHISHAISAMNSVLDEYDATVHQATAAAALQPSRRDSLALSAPFRKPIWTLMSTPHGFSGIAHVSSYNELRMLLGHIRDVQPDGSSSSSSSSGAANVLPAERQRQRQRALAQAGATDLPFAVWSAWMHATQELPRDYPLDVTSQLTGDLLDLYSRTPCCSLNRMPVLDARELLARYHSNDPKRQPSKVLVYAVCAMTARNAFQVHVWSKRPVHESPQYNMGKALSIAYWLAARKMLAECFDEPSLDTCRAALLLSYCSHQNGYNSFVYLYNWITVAMAQELGLFQRTTDMYDTMLAWVIYYWHVWMRVLGAASPHRTSVPTPATPLPPPRPQQQHRQSSDDEHDAQLVLSTWIYRCRLQLQRDKIMSFTGATLEQQQHLDDAQLAAALGPLEAELAALFDSLPPPAQGSSSGGGGGNDSNDRYPVDRTMLQQTCRVELQVQHYINKIMLFYPFLPSSSSAGGPMSPFAGRCLGACLHAAQAITCAIETVVHGCSVPVIGLVFSNRVYQHVFQYSGSAAAVRAMQRNIELSKETLHYAYNFESHRPLVGLMEQKLHAITTTGDKSSTTGWLP